MNPIFIGLLWGLLSGIIIVPTVAIIYWKYRITKMRRMVKRMLDNGEILQPLDKKDYNHDGWKDKIDAEKNQEIMNNLPDLFKKDNDQNTEEDIQVEETIEEDKEKESNE